MFNEIKIRIAKHNKKLYKEFENKKNQTELKSISEIKKKNTLEVIIKRTNDTEEQVKELENNYGSHSN